MQVVNIVANNDLNSQILSLLSEAISERENVDVKLNDIMEYDKHRPALNDYDSVDFCTEGARGSVSLMMGGLILPSEIENLINENKSH